MNTEQSPLKTPPTPTGPDKPLIWSNLHGCSQSLAIMQVAQTRKQPMMLVVKDMASARRTDYELRLFNDPNEPLSVMIFPDWETLPYDRFSPHQDIISERLRILARLPQLSHGIIIIPITTLMQRFTPPVHLQNSFSISKGEQLDNMQLAKKLASQGYHRVPQVMEHGEFSIRGSIIDVFPAGSHHPYRLDLFDNEIECIKQFDTETQRSTGSSLDKLELLPAYEFPLNEAGITHFRQAWLARFSGNPTLSPLYESVTAGQRAAGVEYYLPLFFDQTTDLFEYVPKSWLMITEPDIHAYAEDFWVKLQERYEQYSHDTTRPILTPTELFLPVDQIFQQLKAYPLVRLQEKPTGTCFATKSVPDVQIDYAAKAPLANLQALIKQPRTLICAETAGRQESLITLLSTVNITPQTYPSWQAFLSDDKPLGMIISPMDRGCIIDGETHINVLSEPDLFGQQIMQRRRRKNHAQYQADAMIHNLVELNIGDKVVHINHGIGCYKGLEVIQTHDQSAEYLSLEYADNDKLYVPIASLHLISRYTGGDVEHVPLNHLGSKRWERSKHKAMERIRDVATQLLEIYAKRQAQSGMRFIIPDEDYTKFASGFPFETTPDQQRAIDETLSDMASDKPMDRLICGDVGFGKTEVAMRAAFIATHNHKQVLLLVPTTLLATQHARSFKDRFARWPIQVDYLSRLRTPKEQKDILAEFKAGKLDILIGTHRLLQKDIPLDNVGLLIIDEEHRFGVSQKERIKSIRTQIDILALTATPIPRTLNMTLLHLRDISIIATPPARRLAIKTFVHEYDKGLIREAIQRELLRGGQIYFLHNRVQSIESVAMEVAELVPEAKIGIGHGQMTERALEQVMADFYRQRYNMLVCTTIIESGIDIPAANTIIINRADRLGLSELHQIRGRVGRSHRQAYAYLLVPPKDGMTRDALKRLNAIASLEDLGAGFMLANHDLEIRGAGELLSDEQSGHIQSIGFALYVELLEQAVSSLREGKVLSLEPENNKQALEISVDASALLPETYIPDVHARLILYKRIAAAKNLEQLSDLHAEIIDRFGPMPIAAKTLLDVTTLKWQAVALGITSIKFDGEGGTVRFADTTPVSPEKIIALIQQAPNTYGFKGNNKLKITRALPTLDKRLNCIHDFLQSLA